MTTWSVVYLVLYFYVQKQHDYEEHGSEIDIKRHQNINGIYYYKFHARLNKYFIFHVLYEKYVCF